MGVAVAVAGGAAMRVDPVGALNQVACPACGALTLTREGGQEVCVVCGWQDDPAQRAAPDLADGPNAGVSLTEARAHVTDFGRAFPPSEVGGS